MATSHYCNGKWREGTVASCPKHTKLSRKQPSVYGTSDDGGASSSVSSGASSSGGSSGESASSDS